MCKLFFFTLKRCLSKYSIKENLQVEPIVNTNLPLNIIPLPSDDAVAPMTKCFMELDTNMATALKTPKYGFADICQATYKMHMCMDTAFITDNNHL
jgi:hypothetical protein